MLFAFILFFLFVFFMDLALVFAVFTILRFFKRKDQRKKARIAQFKELEERKVKEDD